MPILDDARIRELSFLTRLELAGGTTEYDPSNDAVERQMIARLLQEAFLNDVGHYQIADVNFHVDWVEDAADRRSRDITHLLRGKRVRLGISHRGRVRRAELEEALRTGRDRDPTGLAIARRYLERDLTIALLHASPETPVSVAVLDMNGLKAINDESGSHAVGDAAIRSYLQVIVSNLNEGWDAYRGEGGDEVTVIFRAASVNVATHQMLAVLQQLQRETVQLGSTGRNLSAACGVAATTTSIMAPAELLRRADSAQYRAKALSRTPGRPATIAIEDREAQVVSQEGTV